MLDFATCTECGRCQSVCPAWNTEKPLVPEAGDHGAARQHVRLGRPPAARREGETGRRGRDARALHDRPRRAVVLHDLRRVRGAVPGGHRARRRHRRHAPLRGAHGVALPGRGRAACCATSRTRATPGASGSPSGPSGPRALDFEIPVVTGTDPRRRRVPLLGRLRRRARRAGPQAGCRPPPGCCTGPGSPSPSSGPKESCTGDPARRFGNEYLFQEMAKANIETLNSVGAKKIVATCPHCFNTIKNEYPALGGNYEVIHHAELLEHLVAAGKLMPGGRLPGHRHLPRPVLPRSAQPGLRRAPGGHRRHPRGRRRSR